MAAALLVVHVLIGNRYGYHRDELQFLEDARHLDWGYVPFPPLTSWLGRASIAVFGLFGVRPEAGPLGLRLPAMLITSLMLLIAGWIARALGGGRFAQVFAALLMLPIELAMGQWLMYTVTDGLAWALVALCIAKLLQTRDARWWIGVGAALGIGILSKYSISFLLASLLIGLVVLPAERVWLRSKWFWAGAAVALLIAAPNLLWEWRHSWVTLHMLQHIHARDVRIGRANGYWTDQLKYMALALPFAVAGVVWLARSARFRLLLFLYAGPLVLFALAKGRGYYAIPGYIGVYAAGAVAFAQWTGRLRSRLQSTWRGVAVASTALGLVAVTLMMVAVAPQGSRLLHFQLRTSSDVRDQFGWREMAAAVAAARDTLPPEERARAGVAVDNYGEAGAIALYGPGYGLPYPISSANDFYYRGYGSAPDILVTLGIGRKDRQRLFDRCEMRGQFVKPNSVGNDDEEGQPIYVCWGMRTPWDVLWRTEQSFG
ncbi:glycosyltransferase family 39 protein [Terriglobus aquaticus]|uniref:Glycosyltransferase family 39 protein n=1 Tax=Terriglobus aquaticus TaxID=940139 RepID=A0ABW9KH12_9BACT|nr:glycosyltransferase family 39 protein [Terriglobus aquaticus]